MDKNALVNGFDAKTGQEAVKALDDAKLDVKAAFWFYIPDAREWRLVVATPAYDQEGPKLVYTRVLEILAKSSLSQQLPLSRISIISPNDPLVVLLSKGISTGPGITDIRFQNNVINGVVIDDAYIYRLQK